MSEFQKITLTPPQRVCVRLKEMRIKRGVTIEEVAIRTRMQKRYIVALEECRFDDLPFNPSYQRHFIKSYAKAIDTDPAPLLAQFAEEETRADDVSDVTPPSSSRFSFLSLPTIARYASLVGVVLLAFGYLGWQVNRILKAPNLLVYTPIQGFITNKNSLPIQGKTDSEVHITINGADITQRDNGEFGTTADLSPGVNTFTITATSKHGKKTIEVRHVILRDSAQFSAVRDSPHTL